MRKLLRTLAAVMLATGLFAVGSATAGADHAGETISVSQTTGLADGTTVRVTVGGFTPNARPVKLVIAGQGKLVTIPDKLNFDEYAAAPEVPIGPDGSGSADFIVTADHGTMQDGTTLNCNTAQCWLIAVQEPFLPQPNYASQEIFFGTNGPATSAPPATEAPTTEAPATTAAPTTTASTTTTTEVVTEEVASSEEDEGSSSGLLFVILAAVVIAIGAGGYFLTKKKPADGFEDPSPPQA